MMAAGPHRRHAAWLVFLTLLFSNAYVWHARDWNLSSRLMLTYALVDRGTVSINGLEDHTYDRARIGSRYYSDKLPGLSLLAVLPYAVEKSLFGLPDHPLNVRGEGFTHWPADYGITVGTSGLATALSGALLVLLAFNLGCGPRRAILAGLSYGLATPAAVYGSLAYGHQVAACGLLGSFMLIRSAPGTRRPALRIGLAGMLAATAAVVELQLGPVSALLGAILLGFVLARRLRPRCLAGFLLGAVGPTLVWLAYNQFAFGSPLDMGYFYEDIAQFREVHNEANPLGLASPDRSKALPLLWGGYRGLLFYAPIVTLAPVGWVVLALRRRWDVLAMSLGTCLAVFFVNLSYPQWTGGFSTGPRLLVPLLPFALMAVTAALGTGKRFLVGLALILALAGWMLMLLFQGAGGRVSPTIADPLREFVLPAWRGEGEGLARNLVSVFENRSSGDWTSQAPWLQFVPLVLLQLAVVLSTAFGPFRIRRRDDDAAIRQGPPEPGPPPARPDPG